MKKFRTSFYFMQQRRGFTLLELIIVVAIISVLAVVVFLILKPTDRFAQSRDAKRQSDVGAIAQAIRVYEIDTKGNTPPGIDQTLRMIGTAPDGCTVACLIGSESTVQPDDDAFVANLQLWLDASDIQGVGNGDTVQTWNDKSGQGRSATQALVAQRPTYHTNVIQGKSVVRFDGVNDYLYTDNVNYEARTVFVVYNIKAALQNQNQLAQAWGSYAQGVHVALDARNGNLRGWSFDGNGNNQGRYAINNNGFGGFTEGTNASQWSYDTVQMVAVEFNQNRAVTAYTVGSLFPAFGVGQHQLGGDIAEIIVYDRVLQADEIEQIQGYLDVKYGLGLNLAEGVVVQTQDACLDLGAQIPNQLPSVPVDPKNGTLERTQYAIREEGNGAITVAACGAEVIEPIVSVY